MVKMPSTSKKKVKNVYKRFTKKERKAFWDSLTPEEQTKRSLARDNRKKNSEESKKGQNEKMKEESRAKKQENRKAEEEFYNHQQDPDEARSPDQNTWHNQKQMSNPFLI